MNFRIRTRICILSAIALVLLTALPSQSENDQQKTDKAAVINGTVISIEKFEAELDRMKKRMINSGAAVPPEQLGKIKADILDNMINEELLFQESIKAGFKSDTKAVDEQLGALKKKFGDEESFKKSLKQMNLTLEDIQHQISRGLSIERLIDVRIVKKIEIPVAASRSFYNANPRYFENPEQVKASHILVKVDENSNKQKKDEAFKKIQSIQGKIKNGGDFASLAKEHSDCPSRQQGGDLGFFKRGQMVKPFEDTAFSLNVGEISDIVSTRFGFHIIKVTDKTPEKTVAFEEVQAKIETHLKQEETRQKVKILIESLRNKSEIQRLL